VNFTDRCVFSCLMCSYVIRLTLFVTRTNCRVLKNGDTFNNEAFKCARSLNDFTVSVKGAICFENWSAFDLIENIFFPHVVESKVISSHKKKQDSFWIPEYFSFTKETNGTNVIGYDAILCCNLLSVLHFKSHSRDKLSKEASISFRL